MKRSQVEMGVNYGYRMKCKFDQSWQCKNVGSWSTLPISHIVKHTCLHINIVKNKRTSCSWGWQFSRRRFGFASANHMEPYQPEITLYYIICLGLFRPHCSCEFSQQICRNTSLETAYSGNMSFSSQYYDWGSHVPLLHCWCCRFISLLSLHWKTCHLVSQI